jgi:hypothetical protein
LELREIAVTCGWIILISSLFLFLISLYMAYKINFRKEWLSLGPPLEMGAIATLFILAGSKSVDICMFLPIVIIMIYISVKLKLWERWVELHLKYSQLHKP